MPDVIELLAGPRQVNEILQLPLGTVGLVTVDGTPTTAFLRAHDRGEQRCAYLAQDEVCKSLTDFITGEELAA